MAILYIPIVTQWQDKFDLGEQGAQRQIFAPGVEFKENLVAILTAGRKERNYIGVAEQGHKEQARSIGRWVRAGPVENFIY